MYEAADELAVRALAAAYTDAVNRRDADGMAAVFAPDGIIEKPGFGEPVKGIEKIAKRYHRLQRERDFLFQMNHSGVVEFVSQDRAVARWWFSELKLITGSSSWLHMMGVYQDQAIRLGEGWRFALRSQTTVWTKPVSEEGLAMFPLPEFSPISPTVLSGGLVKGES